MKNINLCRSFLFFFWITGIGCQLSSTTAIPASQTAESTPVPPTKTSLPSTKTAIPPTPTNTPGPVVDLSWAVIQTGDVPGNLDPISLPLNLISITPYEMLGVEFSNSQVFWTYYGGALTGFVADLSDGSEKKKFMDLADQTTYQSDTIEKFLNNFYNGTSAKLHSKDYNLKNVGDFQVNYTIIFQSKDNERIKEQLEVIFFVRGEIGVFLVNKHPPFYHGYEILSPVAHSLDKRINEMLQTGLPMKDPSRVIEKADLSWLTPRLTDPGIPDGMEQIAPEKLGLKIDEPGNGEVTYDNLFVFEDQSGPKFLFGYIILLDSLDEIGAFDLLITKSDNILEEFALSLGGEDLREYKEIYNLERTGDIRDGRSLTADINGQSLDVSLVVFRNEKIGALLLAVQPPVPDEFFFHDLEYDGVINIRFIANYINYYMEYLFLYNQREGSNIPTPEPNIPGQSG